MTRTRRTRGKRSADVANRVLEPFGIRYASEDTFRSEPLVIPPAARTGVLEGVASLHVTRVLQQEIHHTFEPIVELDLGAIAATAWFWLSTRLDSACRERA